MTNDPHVRRAQQLARGLGLDPTDPVVLELVLTPVRKGMFDDLRDRLDAIVTREPTLYDAEEWSWIQAHCGFVLEDRYRRQNIFPAYSQSLKVPTDKTRRARKGVLIPVTQKALPTKPAPEPGVHIRDPARDVAAYTLAVVRGIERMILGKSRPLPDGKVVEGLTNHEARQCLPSLDWSAEGREESLRRLKAASLVGPIFYGTRFGGEDWSESSHRPLTKEVWYETGKRAFLSHYLAEGEAVLIGPSSKSWISGPGWPYLPGVPVVFEGLPPTVVERRSEDFDPDPPPEDQRDAPRLTVVAVAAPWFPEPESIVHFGGQS